MFDGPSLSSDSFPSGHTAVAFSTATIIGDAYNCGIITYPLAGLVGLARIYKEKHWASDVYFGAVLGLLIGRLNSVGLNQKKESVSLFVKPGNESAIYGIKILF